MNDDYIKELEKQINHQGPPPWPPDSAYCVWYCAELVVSLEEHLL